MAMQLVPFNESLMREQGKEPGWTVHGGESNVVIEQPKLGVVVERVMWMNGNEVAYDQILRAEKGGGVSLPVDEQGRVGLVKYWRPQTTDQNAWAESFPHFNVEELGRESYELPRGFAKMGKDTDGIDTADVEAEEETGSKVTSSEHLAYVCDNTASSPHMTQVKLMTIDTTVPSGRNPDPNEGILSKLEYFSLVELNDLEDRGLLYCCYTNTAISILMRRYPGLLK